MRMLDMATQQPLRNVIVYLTREEAIQVRSALDQLLAITDDAVAEHIHINDSEYRHELTLTIYTKANIDKFDARSRQLLLEES